METSYGAPAMLISCYAATGDTAGMQRAARMTLARAEAALEQDQSNGQALGFGANALAALGDRDRTRDWVARALRIDPDNRTMRYNLACALSLNLGDVDGAVDLLAPFLATANASEVHHVSIDPDLDPLRGDARFRALIAAAEARTVVSG
jgi:adenylate cyclase